MTTRRSLRLATLLLGLALGGLVAWQAPIGPPVPDGPVGLDVPVEEVVADWSGASPLAGVPLFRPQRVPGTPRLTVRGIPGDRTRPVVAAWADGLELIQAHRDVLPGPDEAERIDIEGADEAWRATVHDRDYVYVRRGDTLVLLSGRPDPELLEIGGELVAVSP